MYRGFKITKETISKILQNPNYKSQYENEAQKIKKTIKENLDKYLIPNNKIDVERLREDWFPTDKYDVFISHSHKDIEEIKALAGYLVSVKKLKVFVDSFIWEYFEDLQKNLDDKYNRQENGTYSYRGSNWCCNNVSIILNSALQEVIDNSEAIFFYNTPNSITHNYKDQNRTESPWIFSEIETTRIIRRKPPERPRLQIESKMSVEKTNSSDSARFSFWLNSRHLTNLDKVTFDNWIKNDEVSISYYEKEGVYELDKLYSITKDEEKR